MRNSFCISMLTECKIVQQSKIRFEHVIESQFYYVNACGTEDEIVNQSKMIFEWEIENQSKMIFECVIEAKFII